MGRTPRWLTAIVCLWGALLGSAHASGGPPIRHVFILMLENQNAANTFAGKPPAPYLAQTLPAQGALVPNYYGIGHASLDKIGRAHV